MSLSVLKSFVVSRSLVVLFAISGFSFLPAVHEGFSAAIPESVPWYLSIWYQWDAHWYMSVATDGYQWIAGDQSNVAFFPLYPLTLRAANWLFGHYLLSGLLLSSAFFLVGMLFLYRLVRDDYGEQVAGRTTWLLAIFPTSLFFTTIYTESLFLMTSVAAFYYARKGRWAMAGFWGFLAALTRVTGIFILLPLVYEYMSQNSFSLRRLRPAMLWVMLIPAGLMVYIGYLYFAFGVPLAFAQTQAVGWGHQLTTFTGSITHDLSILLRHWELWVIYEMGATALLAVTIIIAWRKRLPFSYIMYMAISFLFPLAGGTTKSMSRYLLVVFPMFIVLALMTGRRVVYRAVSAVSILLLGLATAAFVTGRWVA